MRTIPKSLTKRPTILGLPVGRRRTDWAKVRNVGIATAAAAGAFRARGSAHVPEQVRDLTSTASEKARDLTSTVSEKARELTSAVSEKARDLPGSVSSQVGKLTGDHGDNGSGAETSDKGKTSTEKS